MKSKLFRLLSAAAIAAIGLAPVSVQAAKIRVVTTLTDLADFAREIGGDHVEVFSLATGVEDTHGVPMKPSFVPIMNRADLMVSVGFGCEHAFLPALLEASKNPRIQVGKPGYVDCSPGIAPLAVPKSTDHSEGDVHPYGNPHYMLDPVQAESAVKTICAALNGLGHSSITGVRQGKFFEIVLAPGTPRERAEREMAEIARDVLANPVIEEYRVEFFE